MDNPPRLPLRLCLLPHYSRLGIPFLVPFVFVPLLLLALPLTGGARRSLVGRGAEELQ